MPALKFIEHKSEKNVNLCFKVHFLDQNMQNFRLSNVSVSITEGFFNARLVIYMYLAKFKIIDSQNVIPGMILSATCKMLRAVSSLICNCLSVKSAIKCPSECPNRWSHECFTSSICACWACKILEWISMNFSQVSGSRPFSSIFLIVLATRALTSLARKHTVQFYKGQYKQSSADTVL